LKNDTQAGTEGGREAGSSSSSIRARPGNRRRRSERKTRESGLLTARGPTSFAQCLGTSALSFLARQLLGRVLALGLPTSLSSDYAFFHVLAGTVPSTAKSRTLQKKLIVDEMGKDDAKCG
jgi:hypothetical protein